MDDIFGTGTKPTVAAQPVPTAAAPTTTAAPVNGSAPAPAPSAISTAASANALSARGITAPHHTAADDAADQREKTKLLVKHLVISAFIGFFGANALASVLYMNSTHPAFTAAITLVLVMMGIALWIQHWLQNQLGRGMTSTMKLIARGGAVITLLGALASLLIYAKVSSNGVVLTILYMWLATGTAYSGGLVMTDIYNRFYKKTKKMVAWQFYAIGAASILVGSSSGLIFGAVDVRDHVTRYGYEQWVNSFIGAAGGLLIGYASFHATDEAMMMQFDAITMDDIDDEH